MDLMKTDTKDQNLASLPTEIDDINKNFKNYTFFHGTRDPLDALKILGGGFKREFVDEGKRYFRDGNLGIGTYLSCNWRTSLFFGQILLHVTLSKDTRILDMIKPPDRKILGYLEHFPK